MTNPCPASLRYASNNSGVTPVKTTEKVASDPIRAYADISTIETALADRTQYRILMALNDGRALPASVLATEAGMTRSTVSSHLGKLIDGGLLQTEERGRYRYYRLAGPQVGRLLEQLVQTAPEQPIRSLRKGTKAAQLRSACTCYDHLAGRLGVSIMDSMLDRECFDVRNAFNSSEQPSDGLAGYGRDIKYEFTQSGWNFIDHAHIKVPDTRRTLVRYCVDWSEQRHHLTGPLGRALLDHFIKSSWIRLRETTRNISVTAEGRIALAEIFGINWMQ